MRERGESYNNYELLVSRENCTWLDTREFEIVGIGWRTKKNHIIPAE